MASNKTTREMPGGLIAIKINNMLKNDNVLDKNGRLLMKQPKKRDQNFAKKLYKWELKEKNIFFTDETRMDTAPNTKGESIRLSSKTKNKLKNGEEEGF